MELGRFAGEVDGERFSRSLGRSLGAFLGSKKMAWGDCGEVLEKPRDFWGRFSPSTAQAFSPNHLDHVTGQFRVWEKRYGLA